MATQQLDKKSVRLVKFAVLFLYLGLACQFTALFLRSWRSVKLPAPWNISVSSSNRYEINTTTIDSDGTPWFVAQKYDGYELDHVLDNHADTWDLPSVTVTEMMTASLAKDDTGNPWLILGKRLAHWDGTEWRFITTPLNADIQNFICPSVVVQDSIVWGIDNATKQTRIIRLALSQELIQSHEILLPEGLESQKYKFDCIISTADNSLLAVLSNDLETDIYQLRNLEWQKITSLPKEQAQNSSVDDMTIDSNGHIWIVLDWLPGPRKPIGKYSPKEDTWNWFDIEEQPDLVNRHFAYTHLAVDKFGRVWLTIEQSKLDRQTSSIAVETGDNSYTHEADVVGVFEERPNDKLVEIRHYTTTNSYVETSLVSRILLGPDHKVWTWHKQLVWMDSDQKELLKPLPQWFVILTGNVAVFGLEILGLIFLGVAIAIQMPALKRRFTQ